jgi:hypothetical protein
LLLFLASCQKSFNEEISGSETRSVKKLASTPTTCLSQTSSEMLLIMHRPSVNYYFVLKNPTGSDSIKQYIFTQADINPLDNIKGKGVFPETNLMAISARKDIYQTIPPTGFVDNPVTPYFYHDGTDIQSPQMGAFSSGPASGTFIERRNQIRAGEELIYKLGDVPKVNDLKMYGLGLFLRVPISSQLVIIDLYNDNVLVHSWRPPVLSGPSSVAYYELKLMKTQVFNEIHFRMQFVSGGGQYAIRGARTNNSNLDPLMYAQATAPRFFLTPEFPDLLYLVGSSTQRRATATGGDDSQDFAANGTSTGPSYLNFTPTGSGATFAIDPIGRYGVTSTAEPSVGITTNKSLTLSTGLAFYANSRMSMAVLRLQNTGPIGSQARIEMLTDLDLPVGTPQTITFTATGQFKQVTLDPGTNFKKIRLTVPGGAPSNSSFVLNPSPPTTSPYQALTRFYPSCN